MICTHENFLYNTGNVNWSYQGHVILYCDQNLRWCAPSGVCVRSSEPAPRELKRGRHRVKLKVKRLLKTRKLPLRVVIVIGNTSVLIYVGLTEFLTCRDLREVAAKLSPNVPVERKSLFPTFRRMPIDSTNFNLPDVKRSTIHGDDWNPTYNICPSFRLVINFLKPF